MTEATTEIATDFLKEYGWWVGGSTNFFHLALWERASSFKSKVQFKARGKTIDAKSFLMIMSMDLVKGTEVTIVADGPDEEKAVRQLKELVETEYLNDFNAKLKEFKEEDAKEAARRAERLECLKQYTTTKKFLASVDRVAFDQDELTDLIGKGTREIYLCANQFVIPLDKKNKNYIGIGKPVAIIQSDKPVNFDELGIKFKNVTFDGDYKKILRKKTPHVKKSVKATQTNTTPEVKPMARKERFALIMEDGAQVRNIDDFKAHFDIGSVVRDFSSGKLLKWLEDRYYDEEADEIRNISPDENNLEYILCKIFKVETEEERSRRIERLNRLRNYTSDEKILSNIDKVAFDQEELADLLDAGAEEIYLCANRFVIPLRMKNKAYIGVKDAVAVIRRKNPVNFDELGINFKNVAFDDDYQKIFDALQAMTKILTRITALPVPKATAKVVVRKIVRKYAELYYGNEIGIFLSEVDTYSFKSKIFLEKNGKTVDAKSVLMVMSLGLIEGDEITIIAEGFDAEEAVAAIKKYLESELDSTTIEEFDKKYPKWRGV